MCNTLAVHETCGFRVLVLLYMFQTKINYNISVTFQGIFYNITMGVHTNVMGRLTFLV